MSQLEKKSEGWSALFSEPMSELVQRYTASVGFDQRLWRADIDGIAVLLVELQKALVALADQHADTVMPGFTHLQVAQPVTFGHHMLAYVEMFARDAQRLAEVRARVNQLPLGAAALAGTT